MHTTVPGAGDAPADRQFFVNHWLRHPKFSPCDTDHQVAGVVQTHVLRARQYEPYLRRIRARRYSQVVFHAVVVAVYRHADAARSAEGFRSREMCNARMPSSGIISNEVVTDSAQPLLALPTKIGGSG
ncbi:MAG TPA: hypothetical protein VJO53_12815 [Candidatus Acidoferrales bacterium]|nr:hypothetical protein [Candidatus Acidoferrales bacterium]